MDVAHINGANIAYHHRPGLGPTIVFANSLGSDQSIWDEVIAALPRGYGTLTYDLRGHGHSDGEADSIEGLADDICTLIDQLGLRNVLFCGVSIGGMIGLIVAHDRPDVVRAAVLCNTATRIGTAERWAARIDSARDLGLSAIAPDIIKNWFGSDYTTQSDRLALHETMLMRTSDAGYIAACEAIRQSDLGAKASAIEIPVHCIAGSEDKSVPPEAVEALAAAVRGATFHVLDRIGHLPCLEAPEALAAFITAADPEDTDLQDVGMRTRRAVLGDAHVDHAEAAKTDFDTPFQTLIAEGAWGRLWSDPTLAGRERSMLTLALLAATGNFEEIPMHIRATVRTGASPSDVMQAFQHVAVYAGVPKANHAIKLAKQTYAELGVTI